MQHHPLTLLRDYDARFRALGRGLPGAGAEDAALWRGIGFRLGDERLLASMAQVREVLSDLQISRVPGTRAWLRGLASVRGQLVTVVDLGELVGAERSGPARAARALYVGAGELQVALLVDEVFGVRQFASSAVQDGAAFDTGGAPAGLRDHLSATVVSADERWWVLDVDRILADPGLRNVVA